MSHNYQEMPNRVLVATHNPAVTKTAEPRVTKEGSESHEASAVPQIGCKTEEERDNCAIFEALEARVQCPKCRFWTKNIGISD